MTVSALPLSLVAPLRLDAESMTVRFACGACGALAFEMRVPLLVAPSSWSVEVRTVAKSVARLLTRKKPALRDIVDAFFADDLPAVYLEIAAGLGHRNDAIRCVHCATVDPSLS